MPKQHKNRFGNDECPICLEEIKPNEGFTLRCSHKYHTGCLSEHLISSGECALCRYEIGDYCPMTGKLLPEFPVTDYTHFYDTPIDPTLQPDWLNPIELANEEMAEHENIMEGHRQAEIERIEQLRLDEIERQMNEARQAADREASLSEQDRERHEQRKRRRAAELNRQQSYTDSDEVGPSSQRQRPSGRRLFDDDAFDFGKSIKKILKQLRIDLKYVK